MSVADYLEQFRSAIAAAGLPVPGHIEPDGALHRFPTNGRPSDDSGWYVLHGDGVPAGAFGDWRSGLEQSWRAEIGREPTAEESRQHRERMERSRREREAESRRRHAKAAERALAIWNGAKPAPDDHAYLAAKSVRRHGLRLYRGELEIGGHPVDSALLVPMRTTDGALHSLQFIRPDGRKLFLQGGRVTATHFAIGKPAALIVIGEGFATCASIHEATGQAVACAFNAGNLESVARALRAKHPGARIVLAADNDDSGTGQREAERGARAVGGAVAIPPRIPGKGAKGTDWNDVARAKGLGVVRACIEAAIEPEPDVPPIPDDLPPVPPIEAGDDPAVEWRDPLPLPDGLPPVPVFDYELLPPAMRNRVADIADRMQCPPDFPAVAMMVTLSGILGRRATVRPKRRDDWTIVPNLWGMVVGRPGIMKSPALDEVLRPLRAVQARAIGEHREELEAYQAEGLVRAERKQAAKKKIQAAIKRGDEATAGELAREAVRPGRDEPKCPRWLANDCSVEKLGELLSENPNGLLLFRDELTGFFRTLERQGHEPDRAFYLEAWNGDGDYTFDRIGRGTVHIERLCIAVLGSIQPGPLCALVRSMRGSGDDGLLQRFQLATWPDQTGEWRNVDRAPDYDARAEIDALFERVANMEPCEEPLRFDEGGQAMFDQWRAELEARLRGEMHPTLEAHLAKYRKLVPALALLCHASEASVGFVSPIPEMAVIRAVGWAEYLEAHAARIYAPAVAPDMDAARALAAKIKAGEVAERFALRDVYRAGWTGLATREDAAAAVAVLADYEWLREDREATGGRARTVYTINPTLRGGS